MNNTFAIRITSPSDISKPIDFGRHFNVWGNIIHRSPVPDDAVLRVELADKAGNVLRHAEQRRKDNKNVFIGHPALKAYPEEMDPGRKKLLEFGFPELMVKDLSRPYDSLRDATIKCWYSDDTFKSVVVSGTDTAHGMPFDDGINYTDENGEPYYALPCGEYSVRVTLSRADGALLAENSFPVTIGGRGDQAMCRFNPAPHRAKMTEWCAQNGFDITNDTLPGYLEPYLGKWLYHMGILSMFYADDIPFYDADRVRMFVYLMEPDSTSYSCELPYLQTKRRVGDRTRFFAYHYDIGEAVLPKDGQKGNIIEFAPGEELYICRVDEVGENAKENVFSLDGENVLSHHTERGKVRLPAGTPFAVMGVLRPLQRDPALFSLNADNSYAYSGAPTGIRYTFECGGETLRLFRSAGMERVNGSDPVGSSMLEFYNVFRPLPEWKDKEVTLSVSADGGRTETLTLCFS